ncbi:aminoacyl-tRNA hydrolase [Ruminococcaceae bacterium OttesenSCG-928-D13]|nr:aminoacyl-tRNA hydrolase [Ruminococcaceae bacterium OttesenSCG-928-D13]
MFFKRRTTAIDWIIAGLGNPGKKYEHTRHNVGFDALDLAAERWNIPVKRSKFDALSGDGAVDGRRVLLLKPQTFMNLSGKSLVKATEYYKVPAERVIVLCDDVNLKPGVLRIRASGSDGGHNGLKSLITFLGEDFPRVRIGVGDKPHPDYDMADWVTGKPSAADKKLIESRYGDIEGALRLLMAGQPDEAMARYNGAPK